MSVFRKMTVVCPACQAAQDFRGAHSVNADLRDDLRLAILNDEFQRVVCEQCERPFRIAPHFTFVDVGRSQWIAAFPLPRLAHWDADESRAQSLFHATYTGTAPQALQAVGRALKPRVVFGWAGLREKLLLAEHELDDVVVELCKAAVLRSSPGGVPVDAQTELRLLAVEGDDLVFGWILAADESVGDVVRVRRALYDSIGEDADGGWAGLHGQLDGGMFVDLNRLMVVPQPAG
jgi:CpXC protein